MKVNKELLKALIGVSGIASKDPTRINLSFVRVRRLDDELQLAATDGHKLVYRTLKADCAEFPSEATELLIDADKTAITMFKALLKRSEAEYGKHSEVVNIDVSSYINTNSGIKFPDVEMVVPKDSEYQELSIGFNAEYLFEMLKAMREENRTVGVKLKFKALKELNGENFVITGLDKHSPIMIEVGSDIGVLMPMRL